MARYVYGFVLTLVSPERTLRRIFDGEECVIGRSPDSDFVVDDANISRRHIVIRHHAHGITVEDLGSSNGTFLNRNELPRSARIHVKPTDEITFGRSNLILRCDRIERHLTSKSIFSLPAPRDQKKEASNLLEAARTQAVESFMMAQAQATKIVNDAKDASRVQAQQSYQTEYEEQRKKGEEMLAERFAEMRRLTQLECDNRLEEAREKAVSESERILKEATEKGQIDAQNWVEAAKKENRDLTGSIEESKVNLSHLVDKLSETEAAIKELESKSQRLKSEIHQSEESKARLERENNELSIHVAQLNKHIGDLKEQKNRDIIALKDLQTNADIIGREIDAKRAHQYQQIQIEFDTKRKELQKSIDDLHQSELSKIRQLQSEYASYILQVKHRLAGDLIIALERSFGRAFAMEQRDQAVSDVKSALQISLEQMASEMSSSHSDSSGVNLSTGWQQRRRWFSHGVVTGLVTLYVGILGWNYFKSSSAPLEEAANQQRLQREMELAARKFDPPQDPVLRSTYTDAVIYTQDFVEVYQSDQFQKDLYKEVNTYMLSKWRIEEGQTLKSIAAITALVKQLHEQKQVIHPNYVKKNIEKMRALETETSLRVSQLFGSEVRFQSFRKIEKRVYEHYVATVLRKPAS